MRIFTWFVILLILAGIALREQSEAPTPVCYRVTGGQAMTVKGTYWGETVGRTIREVAALGDDRITQQTFDEYRHRLYKNVLRLWWKSFWNAGHGKPVDPEILQLREQQRQVEAAAAMTCAGGSADSCQAPTPPDGPPVDRVKSTGTGIDRVAQAASRYWQGNDLVTAVAIAGGESSYNPDPPNPPVVGGSTMRGLWQINEHPHAKLFPGRNWRDPDDNAWMAHEVYKGEGWGAWSVYNSGGYRAHLDEARAAVAKLTAVIASGGGSGKVAALSNSPAAPPVTRIPLDPMEARVKGADPAPPTTPVPAPPPVCDPATGMMSNGGTPGTVGSWNTAQHLGNSAANVARYAGFASVVGLQEVDHNGALKNIPGYGVTEGQMAVPIIYKLSDVELVPNPPGLPSKLYQRGWARESVLRGYAKDKSAVSAVFRDKHTGKVFAVINFHMLVEGGSGWTKQAAAVNRIRARLAGAGYPVITTADMNAPHSKVAAVFGGAPVAHRIDFVIGSNGAKPLNVEVLSKGGSDHARVRAILPQGKSGPSSRPAAPTDFNLSGNRTVEQAIGYMRSHAGSRIPTNACLHYVGAAYGHNSTAPVNGHWYAIDVFNTMPASMKHADSTGTPPRGALVFWKTGAAAGHIAISDGQGSVWTTDPPGHSGTIGLASLSQIDSWGPRVGWTTPYFTGRTTA